MHAGRKRLCSAIPQYFPVQQEIVFYPSESASCTAFRDCDNSLLRLLGSRLHYHRRQLPAQAGRPAGLDRSAEVALFRKRSSFAVPRIGFGSAVLALLAVLAAGTVLVLAFADIKPPVRNIEQEIPRERFSR